MPMIYNQAQNMQPQSIDMQTLQRQQQILQALNPQHQLPQQTGQQVLIDQNIASHSNPMSQHLQQQLYASSMHFQAGLQQQPNLHQLAALQTGSHLFQQTHHQGQSQTVLPQTQPAQSQFQQAFYQKPPQIDYNSLNIGQISGASTMLTQQQQQYTPQQQQIHHQMHPGTSQQHVMHQQTPQQPQIISNQQQRPSHDLPQRQSSLSTEHTRQKLQEDPKPTLKSPTLKSPAQPNANLINARLLKEREEEMLAAKREKEALEKQRIQEELKKRKDEAKEFADTLSERIRNLAPAPLHLATCHTLSKVSSFMPFPSECASTSSGLPLMDSQRVVTVLNQGVDEQLAQYLADVLAETTEDMRDIELKHEEEETNELDHNLITPLVQSVLSFNSYALNVDQSDYDMLNESEIEQAFGKDLQEAVKHVTAEEDAAIQAVFGQRQVHRSDHHNHMEVSSSSNHNPQCAPSTSEGDTMPDSQTDTSSVALHINRDQLRKQMVSVGKQPKAAPTRKKRDMVECLYDSLTGYFDPAKDRRRRGGRSGARGGTSDEEDDSESVHEKAEEQSESNINYKLEIGNRKPIIEEMDEEVGKFFERKRKRPRKASETEENRPPTPTEVIHQRELEWHERQRQRQEKYKRRQIETEADCYNNDVMAENESYCKFMSILDQILEQVEDLDIVQTEGEVEINQELLIERSQVDELRMEAQKLKSWRKVNKVNSDKLVKLLMVLERNIRDVLNDEGQLQVPVGLNEEEDESDEAYRELMDDRLIRSIDAACTVLTIMTSPKMPKQVLLEDAIERSIQLCKQYLQNIVYPAVDSSLKISKSKKTGDGSKRKRPMESFGSTTSLLYSRVVDLIGCFSELARFHSLNDSVIIQLSTLATPPFFIDNIAEVQVQSIKLLSTIFSKSPFLRKHIIDDLLNSLHRLPSTKNQRNSYRLGGNDYITNFTVLILQLLQSAVKLPFHNKRSGHLSEDISGGEDMILDEQLDDRVVLDSYKDAESLAKYFLYHFLTRCTAKSEDDYRRLFEQFLQEVLMALYRPEWPIAELVLSVLGCLLVMFFRNQNVSKQESASLDYLGTIAARLRKDRVMALGSAGGGSAFENQRLDLVVKGIMYDETNDMSKTLEEIDINHLSSTEKLRKLEQALIDYIIGTKGESDVSVEYIVTFYAVEWYRMTVLDVNAMKQKYEEDLKQPLTQREISKIEKKLDRIKEKGTTMKEFIRNLMDKKHLKKRTQHIAKNGNVMIDSDAYWVVKYLASKKELSQSFDYYLNNILEGFNPIYPVAIRTKAMKCLSQIVESDHHVLMMPDVNKIVQDRLIDPNAAVREATFELIGKYLVSRPDLLNAYYGILLNRIKDSAIAVRKRVIRILKDVVDKQPKLDKKPEILGRIINRINDEEGVRKLCLETFQNLWFMPLRESERTELDDKVMSLTDVASVCLKDNILEQLEQLMCAILSNCQEKITIYASKQIVDALVDKVISLNLQIAKGDESVNDAEALDEGQVEAKKRLFSSLATLSVFAKARPELLVPHADVFLPYVNFSKQGSTKTELQVLNQIVTMLERIVPLMEHPSESFLTELDTRLNSVANSATSMVIIASTIACMSAAYEKFKKVKPGICSLFLTYLRGLSKVHNEMENDPTYSLPKQQMPVIKKAIYTVGLMCRHFDFDRLLAGTPDVVKEKMFSLLLAFSRSREEGITMNALIALGQYSAGVPDLLTRIELRNMYTCLLKADKEQYLQLKVQVLKNLSCFLRAEEDRAIKKNIQFRKQREEQKEDDLKEMELSSSGLSSSVIQVYWPAVLNGYVNREDAVRIEAAQVIGQTLEQGLVTPGSSIPTLMAMSTDPLPVIRVKIETLIRDIDTKYSGMIASKTSQGVPMTLRLQKEIRSNPQKVIRGIRMTAEATATAGIDEKTGLPRMSNDAQSLLSGFYVAIRTNRQQRRNFLATMLRFFEENVKLEVEDWIFIADNLAHFPYQLLDEPLYVIHQANSIIDISGQNIQSSFKQMLTSRKRGYAQSEYGLGDMEDDDDLTAEMIFSRLPNDKAPIHELKKSSQACLVLLHLKFFLMKMYGLKEDKIKEYSPLQPAKVYEKPMTRRNVATFSPDSIISELSPEAMAGQDTIEGHMKLAEHFHNFIKMLLSLNKQEDDDMIDDNEELTTTVGPGDEEVIDGEESNQGTSNIKPPGHVRAASSSAVESDNE
ncbi:HEAT repeat associated with sister chromatid cohesion domain-containing protein [Ditylenchus destructor]|uniref:Nipped-B protein n=1 Tax=Ditylenchus destructor TaxID=166010 RepID=A0AAD4QZQ7_9BILA|nr:HEAT repeat associated with sister chromatid cohesion domain-containing protein [Ditylenchus destructor]